MTRREIMAELLKLDVEARIELAEFLWDSVGDAGFSLTDEQTAELDRRIRDFEDGPSIGVPWEQVRADILKKLDPIR